MTLTGKRLCLRHWYLFAAMDGMEEDKWRERLGLPPAERVNDERDDRTSQDSPPAESPAIRPDAGVGIATVNPFD